ncbi:hypothetical protein D3C84_926890 [compost metagenome]|uniref:hypothetical protein n=1 Tax=Pseudomonas sp. FW300-N1A1 TaxID=2075555 RepID=UPI000CD26505|nr:hypothetical protein [Pseudomonas sp. FW300-N1A1]POA17868.1 hypothetical protein C1886_19745 [Pseudomonas sp. FW300-N1A1]
MSIMKAIVLNEKPEEVILFLTKNELGISFPQLDGLYNRASWAHVTDNMGLFNLVKSMCDAGFIKYSGGGIVRGPNWREPAFMVEGKYTLD